MKNIRIITRCVYGLNIILTFSYRYEYAMQETSSRINPFRLGVTGQAFLLQEKDAGYDHIKQAKRQKKVKLHPTPVSTDETYSEYSALRLLTKQAGFDKKKGITLRVIALEDFYKSFDDPCYVVENPSSQILLKNLGLLNPLTNKISAIARTLSIESKTLYAYRCNAATKAD